MQAIQHNEKLSNINDIHDILRGTITDNAEKTI